MKTNNFFKIFMLLIAALVFATAAAAQEAKPADGPPPQQEKRPPADQPRDMRGNMLRQLGLSQEQIQQMRRVNAERKPLMDGAQKRFREANHALDEAIYADQVNEADVQARLKEVQLAQAEVAKIRFMNELAVRRILTQEQLIRFRELRQRFEIMRENFENRRPFNDDRPFNRQQPGQDVNKLPNGHPAPQTPARPGKEKPVL